ncbi:MAG: hypothetical protein Q4E53_12225 [Eubacteriales bacterium]|nr:hypothetical protein [Eubacteriales bacterium]
MKLIETNGIAYIELLAENSDWYCGTDYSCGDLYEAEEVYNNEGKFKSNRLIFIHHPDGKLVEPVKLSENQYFGRPTQIDGIIYILLVDFNKQIIQVFTCSDDFQRISVYVELPLSEIKDCYNLLLKGNPLMITRQGSENEFEVIWPEKVSFKIGETESFIFRKNDEWVFSKWIEDPDYREEIVVRNTNGEITKTIQGEIFISPTGEVWILN